MNTLIAYATKYGCTEKCAKILSKKLTGKVDLLNLKEGREINLSQYDTVIIGGSIYIGKIHKEVTDFCNKNLNVLKEKKIGLFQCSILHGDKAAAQLNTVFPQKLITVAIAKETFGGEFTFNDMNTVEKIMAKMMAKMDKDGFVISDESIDRLAQVMNNV